MTNTRVGHVCDRCSTAKKILHVWDQASTASVIAKWQRRLGHSTAVIKNSKHDKNKETEYYGGFIIKSKIMFVLKSIFLARKFDIIHLHDAWFMVIPVKLLYPKKKIIMHYHGSMIRAKMKETRRKIWEKYIDQIIVSTPDLLEFEYSKQPYYIPNPVDTELFKPIIRPHNYRGLISLKDGQTVKRIEMGLENNGFDIEVLTIPRKNRVTYEKFHEKLSNFEFYIDHPFIKGKMIRHHSACGLQALALGLKVINWDFDVIVGLPDFHRPENVVKEIEKIYEI